ncbi:hypothetical protein [Candidatus Nitrotoga arctica]|uniref:Uncharacterized protein n=1 Tax=Candidatus Nitrotoga arctica TaxID=453162 RepID=A0ABN8AP27_9PROT|nr:hypothetical protein [Candidatus Nitrotoga arctica]CAG9932448.1 conserved protein of unknown function [Candidatus Nitrotoga arctica]
MDVQNELNNEFRDALKELLSFTKETSDLVNEYKKQSIRNHERNTLLFTAAFREIYHLNPESKQRIQLFIDEILSDNDDPEFTLNVVKDAQEVLKAR